MCPASSSTWWCDVKRWLNRSLSRVDASFTRRVIRGIGLSAMLLLTACGWQLQGARHIADNLQPLYVHWSDVHSEFALALQERLRIAGVRLTDNINEAHATLNIAKDETSHRVISVSTANTPLEYEVFYNVEVNVQAGGDDTLLQQPLSAARSYTYTEAAALAKQREEEVLTSTLAGELADQVMRQLKTL